MCLVFVCDQDERVIGRYAAPGACPYCGGAVQVVDVNSQWRFCFVPLSNKSKRRHLCSTCGKRLIVHGWKQKSHLIRDHFYMYIYPNLWLALCIVFLNVCKKKKRTCLLFYDFSVYVWIMIMKMRILRNWDFGEQEWSLAKLELFEERRDLGFRIRLCSNTRRNILRLLHP